jgi:hypothetical protein
MMRIVNKIPQMAKRQISVKNSELKLCKNCVHFTDNTTNDPFDLPVDDISLGRCKLFGKISVVTGEKIYNLAEENRYDDTKCGLVARHFKQIVGEPKDW